VKRFDQARLALNKIARINGKDDGVADGFVFPNESAEGNQYLEHVASNDKSNG
jgi:hypothetical protein